jgi:hypothetical protein
MTKAAGTAESSTTKRWDVAVGPRSQAPFVDVGTPTNLRDVGQALASRPESPFVAATTGSTNLLGSDLPRRPLAP